jgi:ABC-2 type transport system permease protein
VSGLLAATLGGGAGLVAWFSVYMPTPGLDPHQRADNPLETADDSVGVAFVVFFAALVPPLPAAGVLTLGTVLEDPVLVWAGAAVGIATGVLVSWALGHVAARRLVATAPDLLFLMRTSHTVGATTVADPDAAVPNPVVQTLAWTLGSLAMFPQGLVPIVLKLTGNDDTKVWFLAMYLPGALGWITAFAMVAVGLTLYGVAIADLRHPSKAPQRGAESLRRQPPDQQSRTATRSRGEDAVGGGIG